MWAFLARSGHGWSTRASVLWLALALMACDEREPSPPEATPAAPSSLASAKRAGPPPPIASASLTSQVSAPCRVIRLAGTITRDPNEPLKLRETPSGQQWLSLDKDSSATFKHGSSAREYAVLGEGRALPCFEGDETVLLLRGRFVASPGFGARPGAQVQVATPFGIVSYSDANVKILATEQRIEVEVTTGTVSISQVIGVERVGKGTIQGRGKTRLVRLPAYSHEGVLAHCERVAAACEAIAKQVVEKVGAPAHRDPSGARAQPAPTSSSVGVAAKTSPPQPWGALAGEHVRARADARAACLVARTSLAQAAEPDLPPLLERLTAAEKRWRTLPRPSRPSQK